MVEGIGGEEGVNGEGREWKREEGEDGGGRQ